MRRAVAALLVSWLASAQGAEVAPVLERDPRGLPRAAAGHWSDWRPDDGVPEEHREALARGMIAYGQGDYVPALDSFYRLLEREPDYPPALYQAATTYFRLRRYGDCIVLLERFSEVVPHEIGATQALGHSLYSLGRYEEAREHYARVLAKQPDSVEAIRGYALAHMRLGDTERALELLERVVELRPTHADAHAWIAQLHFESDRLEPALAAVTRALELAPHEPRSWFLVSRIRAERGEDELALAAKARFEELSRLAQETRAMEGVLLHDPENEAARRQLIALRTRAGDRVGVGEELERMLRSRPTDLELRLLALDTFVALEDDEAARVAALELERFCADRPEAWKRLQEHYGSIGDRVRQVQAGERYHRLMKERGGG